MSNYLLSHGWHRVRVGKRNGWLTTAGWLFTHRNAMIWAKILMAAEKS